MSFTLRDLAAPLFRRQRVLILVFLIVFVAAAVVGLARWHTYEAHLAILVGRELPVPPAPGDSSVTEKELDAEADLLRSRDLLQQVVLANGMQSVHHFWLDLLHPGQAQADRMARAVQALASQIDIETTAGADLIEVTYSSPDPALAYGVLNSLSKIFLEKHAQAQNEKAAMEDAEAGLRVLAQEPTVPDHDPRDRKGAPLLPGSGSSGRQSSGMPSGSIAGQDPQAAQQLLEKLTINLLDAERKRTLLLEKYEPGSPLVKEANQQIAAIKQAIAEGARAKEEADLANHRAWLAADRQSMENLKAPSTKAGSQSLDDSTLQREAQQDERNYLQYLAEREQARVANAHSKIRAGQVAIAIPPARPVLPAHGLVFIFLIAFASAALVSFPTVYFLDYFDPSFHTPAQVTEILRVPVVVAVPKNCVGKL